MIEIHRAREITATITAASSAATSSPRIAFAHAAGGAVLIANTNSCTQITWYAAAGAEDQPLPIYSDGSAVTSALTVGAINMPDSVYPFPFVVPVVTGGTTCDMVAVLKG